ncbi:MAG: right-handed parallel beta-helix repeat-containing protein [Ruminococcus sp.]|nr:right-handed parallel beta-helix repeat-containing protein [Ruminococcus sp.]
MKKTVLKFTSFLIITLYIVGLFTVSVSQAASYTNSKGTATVKCGKYTKKFKAKKYGHNFSRALNEALNVARKKATASKPATVTVSKGNYSLDRTLKIYSNTILKASGCTFKYYGNLLRNGYNGKTSAASGYNGSSNITIDGGTWDAAVPYSQAGTSNWRIQHSTLRFGHCKNLTVKNCKFRNNYNCHDIELGGVNGAKITKCSFYNDKAVNTFENDGGRESIQLDVTTSPAMPEFKKYDNTTTKNVTLSYCDFKNKFRAIGSHHAVLGEPFDNISVHHNYFRNIGGITVYGVYWTNSKIYSNTMDYVGLGVDMRNMTIGSGYNFTNSKNLTCKESVKYVKDSKLYIYDNKITVRKKDNTYVRPTGIRVMGEYHAVKDKVTGVKAGTYKIYNVNIGVNEKGDNKANTIKGNVAVGIQANYAVNSVISGNTINASGSLCDTSNGIEVKGSEKVKVTLNTVKNGKVEGAVGILLTKTAAGFGNKNVKVNSNTVSAFASSGIYVRSSANTSVKSNTVSKTDDMGISVKTSDSTTVDKNTLDKIGKNSLCVYSESVNTTLTNNTITNPNKSGIMLKQASATKIDSNDISNCGEYGVLIRESSATEMLQNNINDPALNGVRVNYGSDNTIIQNNSINSPKSECVCLNGTNDMTKEKEKSLEVSNNYLNTAEDKAAVSVSKDNVAAKVYSNYRNDGEDLFYSFKGDSDADFTNVKEPITLDDLTVNKFESYNMLNWNFAGDNISYRVYREDEKGTSLISDTPEHFCMDNNIFNNGNALVDLLPDKDEVSLKIKILSYSVTPYKAFSNVKYLGEPITVDYE